MNTSSLQIRAVRLRVRDLKHSRKFYAERLGFRVVEENAERIELTTEDAPLGANAPRLILLEGGSAPVPPTDASGLFHAALVLPSRAALGRWLAAATQRHVAFAGFSDHGVSEAMYLDDPDGNGLEFYVDRPRDQWPFSNGELAMFTLPLDVRSLLSAGADDPAAATSLLAGARWGHLHFRVTDLDRTEQFYGTTLGLSRMQQFGASARFLSRDGYHHHLGINTWGGVNQPHRSDALGLVDATVAVQGETERRRVTDPDGIALELVPL